MKNKKLIKKSRLVIVALIATILIISINHIIPTSKAELEEIEGTNSNLVANQTENNADGKDTSDDNKANNSEEEDASKNQDSEETKENSEGEENTNNDNADGTKETANKEKEDDAEENSDESILANGEPQAISEEDDEDEEEIDNHNVIYIAWTSGSDKNDGTTIDTAVKTIKQAYTLLNKISGIENTTVDDNYIVIIEEYGDTTNEFGNKTDSITFSVPATITGSYGTINEDHDSNPEIYFFGGHGANNKRYKLLKADTKFEYLTFKGTNGTGTNDGALAYIYCQGHNLTMGRGLVMKNYQVGSLTNFGMPTDVYQPGFNIIGGWLDCNFPDQWPEEAFTITVQSGSYARVCGGSRTASSVTAKYMGSSENHIKVNIVIDYNNEDGKDHTNLPTYSNKAYAYDIGMIVGGQTDCSAYIDSTINLKNGTVARIVGGSQGNDKKSMPTVHDENKYIGSSTINIQGGYVSELIGASQGRNILYNYYEGTVNINISGGKLGTSGKEIYIYGAGAAAFIGGTEEGVTDSATVNINITGGEINGYIYGGSYGYSEKLSADNASEIQGMFYGNTTINVQGGTINGNIYGGGRGTTSYSSKSKNSLAQLQGNVTINISNNAKITGNVYGAGQGFTNTKYADMAKVTGNVTINIEDVDSIDGNIYGGAESAQVVGNVEINIKNTTLQGDIFGGGNAGKVEGSTALTLEGITASNVYGGGNSGTVESNTSVNIVSGTITNVFGGGNLGVVNGNTDVTVGTDSTTTTISEILYGGGKGESSDTETVAGSANVTITGSDTNVENYGSSKLGKVVGDVYVTFKDYKTKNPTALYKRMNGIDRATTVTFDHSYVLLENKLEDGTLQGIEDITNIVLPEESGLKISANGEILGDFSGGGELYLDSEVCLTVRGDMKDAQTILRLNVKDQQITGGIENPYMIVYGDSEAEEEEKTATRLISGEDSYEILTQKSDNTNNLTYYYIGETIMAEDGISKTLINAQDRVYQAKIENEEDIEILSNTAFTNFAKIDYSYVNDGTKGDKYKNITKSIILENATAVFTIPKGTEITMIIDGKYYSYIVPASTTKIDLSNFVSFTDGTNYSNEFDLTQITDEEYVTTNPATQTKTYNCSEEYRFIINFSNCEQYVDDGLYCINLEIQDDKTAVDTESTTNMIQISSREYTYQNTSTGSTYKNNGAINIEGTLKLSKINTALESLNNKGLSARIKIEQNENLIDIPEDALLTTSDGKSYSVQNGVIEAEILSEVTNLETIQDINMALDMSNVLQINRLASGKYNLVIEFVLNDGKMLENTAQMTAKIPFEIIEIKSNDVGLKAEIQSIKNVSQDKVQVIDKGEKATRTVKLSYSGTISSPSVKISILEKTGKFEYTDITNTENSSKIKIKIGEQETSQISSLGESTKVTINFGNDVSAGTYKVVFKLYDESGEELTEAYSNFIVWE
jgi:hypothetical protein